MELSRDKPRAKCAKLAVNDKREQRLIAVLWGYAANTHYSLHTHAGVGVASSRVAYVLSAAVAVGGIYRFSTNSVRPGRAVLCREVADGACSFLMNAQVTGADRDVA